MDNWSWLQWITLCLVQEKYCTVIDCQISPPWWVLSHCVWCHFSFMEIYKLLQSSMSQGLEEDLVTRLRLRRTSTTPHYCYSYLTCTSPVLGVFCIYVFCIYVQLICESSFRVISPCDSVPRLQIIILPRDCLYSVSLAISCSTIPLTIVLTTVLRI